MNTLAHRSVVVKECFFSPTDNGLEFQKLFHPKCEEVGLEHFYIHNPPAAYPNDNAVIERSFRTDEESA